jgi:hypothetical protein
MLARNQGTQCGFLAASRQTIKESNQMNGRRAVVGLCMLCALFVSAFAAQGASAQTAVTCAKIEAKNVGEGFTKAHCKPVDKAGASEKGAYTHVNIPPVTTTELTGTNEKTGEKTETKTVTKLKSVRAGVELELQATGVSGSGTMTNKEEGGVQFASGSGTITYSGVTVTKPAGKGCVVTGGTITTNSLSATTKGLTNELLFTPTAGSTAAFANWNVTGCSVSGLNGAYEVTGSVKGQTEGATTNFTHTNTTSQGTLFLSTQKAGIEGTITLGVRANSSQAYTAVGLT